MLNFLSWISPTVSSQSLQIMGKNLLDYLRQSHALCITAMLMRVVKEDQMKIIIEWSDGFYQKERKRQRTNSLPLLSNGLIITHDVCSIIRVQFRWVQMANLMLQFAKITYTNVVLDGSVAKFENQTRPFWTPNILGWYSH